MHHLQRIAAAVLMLAFGFSIAVVSLADSKTKKDPVVAYEVTEYTMIAGKSQTIAPIVQNYTGKVAYTYTSEDESIATVNNSGRVNAINPGTVTIHCHAEAGEKEFDLSYTLTVYMLIKRIKVGTNKITLNTYETFTPDITIEPENASNKTLEWTSSDSDVAYIDINGVIHAKCVGKSTLTGVATDGSNTKTTITVEVPAAIIPTDAIVIDDPKGVILTYTLNRSNKGNHSSLFMKYYWDEFSTTNDCFSAVRLTQYGTEYIPHDDWVPLSEQSKPKNTEPPKEVVYPVKGYDPHIIQLMPNKQGNGRLNISYTWYDGDRNHTNKYTINVKVTRNAVYMAEKFQNYGKNAKLLGQRFLVTGTVKSHTVNEEKCEIVLNVDDASGQYVVATLDLSLNEELKVEDGMRLTIKGIFDHMDEYTAPSGLSYNAPFFNAEKLETE